MEAAPFTVNVHMPEAEVMETLRYECVTWTLGKVHFAELRTAHHNRFLARIVASIAENAQTTSCRAPRPLRKNSTRAPRRPSASCVSSLRGTYSGRTMSDYPVG